jgi:hypothetical protein
MTKSIDEQIKAAMATKIVGQTTEIYKAVVLELDKRITAHSVQVGIQDGSPVLTGRYYVSRGCFTGVNAMGDTLPKTRAISHTIYTCETPSPQPRRLPRMWLRGPVLPSYGPRLPWHRVC